MNNNHISLILKSKTGLSIKSISFNSINTKIADYLMGYKKSINVINVAIAAGILFSGVQAFEYYNAPFTIADSVFGSAFFVLTGFHGIHVLVGTIILQIQKIRLNLNHFSPTHHVGILAAI